MISDITQTLGPDAEKLLAHICATIRKEQIHLPGPDYVERSFVPSDRNARVIANLHRPFHTGRLAGRCAATSLSRAWMSSRKPSCQPGYGLS